MTIIGDLPSEKRTWF